MHDFMGGGPRQKPEICTGWRPQEKFAAIGEFWAWPP